MAEVDEVRGGDVSGGGKGVIVRRLAAVEIAVAAARGAPEGGGVRRSSVGGGHEFAAAVHGVAAHTGRMILQAFFINHRRRRRLFPVHGGAVGKRQRLKAGLGWGIVFRIRGFGGGAGGQVHGRQMIKKRWVLGKGFDIFC